MDPDPPASNPLAFADRLLDYSGWWLAPVHVGGYLVGTVLWLVVLLVGAVLAVLFLHVGIQDLAFLAVLTSIQLVGMAAMAVAGASLLPPRGWSELPRALGLHRTTLPALGSALALGLVVGVFPSWLSELASRWLPSPLIDQLVQLGLDGTVRSFLLTAAMVCVFPPICEELVFRGYLWSAMDRSGARPVTTWLFTSLLFTAYHVDPSQMVGVLPIALALGWTRWRTGSLWPGMLLHFANNALALAASTGAPDDQHVAPWLAVLGLALSLALCAAVWRLGGPPVAKEP